MTPYSGLLFFGILILALLPAVILGLLGKSLRIYGLIATVLLLLTAFDTWQAKLTLLAFWALCRNKWRTSCMQCLLMLTQMQRAN